MTKSRSDSGHLPQGSIAGPPTPAPTMLKVFLFVFLAAFIGLSALLAMYCQGNLGSWEHEGTLAYGPVDKSVKIDEDSQNVTGKDGVVHAIIPEDYQSAGEFVCQYRGLHNSNDADDLIPSCTDANIPDYAKTSGQMPFTSVLAAMVAGMFGLVAVTYYAIEVMKRPTGTATMREIAGYIEEGAQAFLHAEFRYILVFLIIMFVLMLLAVDVPTAGCYLFGGLFSGATGYLGMSIAVKGNVRTAAAAEGSLSQGLQVAFRTGAVMGLAVVSVGLFGISLVYIIFENSKALAGFGAGASTIALFMRVGGGIYTKAADVGADLVGKVEADIPEDDPRNPATIADNVGDNVGDVAGMGADLFESFIGTIVASIVLGSQRYGTDGIAFTFLLAACGVVACVFCSAYVHCNENSTMDDLLKSLTYNVLASSFLIVVCTLGLSYGIFSEDRGYDSDVAINVFISVISGLICGILIGKVTEYFTSHSFPPTKSIAQAAQFGAGPVIIQGLGEGMYSTVVPLFLVVITLVLSYELQGFFGTAIASLGMLSTLGVTMATDAYGPVADNAGGIAEMSELPSYVRDRTDLLDALGNTTAATGKGFATGSAVLAALGLLAAFSREARIAEINMLDRLVIVSLLIGAMLPFLFSALTMLAVNRAAQAMIVEVRRQFREIDGLREGVEGVRADYNKCVSISTTSALREMILPGLLAVAAPMIIGFWFGLQSLGAMLLGGTATGYLLGVMMSAAGGAWDNAKKYVESGAFGKDNGKGSDWHKAAVAGDTVGDPFKDTSGPSLNILIKIMVQFALVFTPIFESVAPGDWPENWYIGVIAFVATVVFVGIFSLYIAVKEESAQEAAAQEATKSEAESVALRQGALSSDA
eukprot:TRINITY_DN560_c0_g1::TRINITY_DN560_c0_g1_i1::g.10425::m.10425 TRINITY_DN560_c0_g1::TRINITY_DN560_c0_g1_i1::g.10425  ORF type:complete len:896 (+),score=348.00,sp/Q898Q9/HPPA_CLOTE/50.74/0.0,H_PPase/PF03030.11/1.5e-246,H_PPase/PF03030.11/20,CRT-like/PF08627.5/1.7e+02,CRT-like/PF08627.5/1.2 TRINITY_DN560_c0_g1_i1:73-2688(+)